jgi:pilus assembly protein CpaC
VETPEPVATAPAPITVTRNATSIVRLRDGGTVIISGMMAQNEQDGVGKFPILGDLPVLGHLFKRRTKQTDHSEVVIMITVHLINE